MTVPGEVSALPILTPVQEKAVTVLCENIRHLLTHPEADSASTLK